MPFQSLRLPLPAFYVRMIDVDAGRRIEVVITSRTRNAVVLRGTWVRIPPSPPNAKEALRLFSHLMGRDSNPRGNRRKAKRSGGAFRSRLGKPTERGGAGRRMRSIRVNPTVSAKTLQRRRRCQTVDKGPIPETGCRTFSLAQNLKHH